MIAAATSGALWARYVESQWFEVTRSEVRIPGVRAMRLLHIADIHMSDAMPATDLERGLTMGLNERPDLICLTGDFVSTTLGFEAAALKRMLRRSADTAPVLAVLGNHDGGRWQARYGGDASVDTISELVESAGVTLLDNRSVQAHGVRIVGLADLWAGGFDARAAFSEADQAEERTTFRDTSGNQPKSITSRIENAQVASCQRMCLARRRRNQRGA